MLNRRKFLINGTLAIHIGCNCNCNAATIRRGCSITSSEAMNYMKSDNIDVINPIRRTGNSDFDYASAQMLANVSDIFGILPGFCYFKGGPSFNAFATPDKLMKNPDGTVIFGKDLLLQIMDFEEGPEAAFAGICAHEFAHIVQFKLGLMDILMNDDTARKSELHADFLAGYFVGTKKKNNPNFHAAVVADTFSKLGDDDFRSPTHHGTPEERARSIIMGFNSSYRDNVTFNDAVSIGVKYVKSL